MDFGVVTRVTIRLVPRFKVKRIVEVIAVRNLMPRIDAAIEDGFIFGDCQYSIDLHGGEEFHPGVFSCYSPVPDDTPVPERSTRWRHPTGPISTDSREPTRQRPFQLISSFI